MEMNAQSFIVFFTPSPARQSRCLGMIKPVSSLVYLWSKSCQRFHSARGPGDVTLKPLRRELV